jgi:hypothetical protein
MIKDYTKIGIAAALGIFLIFLIVQIVKFSGLSHEARATYEAAKADYDATATDHDILREDFEYYSDPENLAKELRARFNYTLPGEKMLIFVQEGATTTISD